MSYLQKYNQNLGTKDVSMGVSMTIPHQSFTPREILAQFVRNDVQVQMLQPSDELDDSVNIDDIETFEDDFAARERVNQIRVGYNVPQKDDNLPNQQEIDSEKPSEEAPEKPSEEAPEKPSEDK